MKTRCVKTIFDRVILCAGTMTDYITIKKREIQGTTVNDNQAEESFTDIENFMGYIEAKKPTVRFDGINILNEITHVAYSPFDQTVYELDVNTLFIQVERNRNRIFKLLQIMNYGEQDEYLAYYLKETGFSDIKANEG